MMSIIDYRIDTVFLITVGAGNCGISHSSKLTVSQISWLLASLREAQKESEVQVFPVNVIML